MNDQERPWNTKRLLTGTDIARIMIGGDSESATIDRPIHQLFQHRWWHNND